MTETIHVCRPAVFLRRKMLNCPTCKARRRMSVREAAWYGATVTCCGCGDAWTDGERHQRPFKRGWRTQAVAAAKRDWDNAGPFDKAAYESWFREELGDRVPTA